VESVPEGDDEDDQVTVCPQCLSPRVSYETGHFPGQKYRCKSCGNVTSFIIEASPEEIEEIAQEREDERAEGAGEGGEEEPEDDG
jgi:hypothetical protein